MENNTAPSRIQIVPLLGGLLLIVTGGWLTGMAAGLVGSIFTIALVFPAVMGVAAGWLVSRAVKWIGVRDARQVVLLSVLAAVVVYGTCHYGRYVALQLRTWLELSSSVARKADLQVAKVMVDYALEEETGYSGLPGYMLYKAETGISIGRFYRQSRLALTSLFAWLYWALEFGIILWIAKLLGEMQARRPRCECCGKWYIGRERHLGGTAPANESLLLDLLRQKDVAGLGQLIEKDAGLPSLELYLQRCEACGEGAATITVHRAELGARGAVVLSQVSKATLPPGYGARFLNQLRYEPD